MNVNIKLYVLFTIQVKRCLTFYSTGFFIILFTEALDRTLSRGGSVSFYVLTKLAQIHVLPFELTGQMPVWISHFPTHATCPIVRSISAAQVHVSLFKLSDQTSLWISHIPTHATCPILRFISVAQVHVSLFKLSDQTSLWISHIPTHATCPVTLILRDSVTLITFIFPIYP